MIQDLSDFQLERDLNNLVKQEREILHHIIIHIREVSRRKLYLKRARSSLFEYLTSDMGYSSACAQRRIDAARLTSEIPGVLEKVKDGVLNLSQISLLQQAVRQKEKLTAQRVSTREKVEILSQIENKSGNETEKTVALSLDLPVISKIKTRVQGDDSVHMEITLTKEQWDLLKRCQELLAHKNASGDLSQVIGEVCQFFQSKKDPLVQRTREKLSNFTSAIETDSAAEVKIHEKAPAHSDLRPANTWHLQKKEPLRKPIPNQMRRQVFQRDRVCQFKDPMTSKICGSRFQLEIDHLKMVCHGGSNELSNLRLMCRQHNAYIARQKLGHALLNRSTRIHTY